mmetsp:Transcript_102340/g.265065  ORF Transcript_102340/g.265065 Transcript_102340/m.265065 type:complete len:131 (-) Transcript_102340:20-412(-)
MLNCLAGCLSSVAAIWRILPTASRPLHISDRRTRSAVHSVQRLVTPTRPSVPKAASCVRQPAAILVAVFYCNGSLQRQGHKKRKTSLIFCCSWQFCGFLLIERQVNRRSEKRVATLKEGAEQSHGQLHSV